MTATWHYRIPRIDSWQRDKVTARGGKPRTHRPVGDAEAKRAHALAALAARPRGWDLTGVYSVAVYYCRETGHRRDVDRVLSLVLDALTGVAWADDADRYVKRAVVDRIDPGVVIGPVVFELADGQTAVVVTRVGDAPIVAKRRLGRGAA